MQPWWSLRGKERAEAKAADERIRCESNRHPVEVTLRSGIGGWKHRGRYYGFRTDDEKRLQFELAAALLPPVKLNLCYFRDNDGWYAIGQRTSETYRLGERGDNIRMVSCYAQAASQSEYALTKGRK